MFSDVDDSLCLPDPVIHRDVAPVLIVSKW